MSEFREIHRETGIPCFKCKERSGIDCAGRRPDEATLCVVCLDKMLATEKLEDERRMKEIAERVMEENKDVLKKLADS